MQGPEYAADRAATYLADAIPARLRRIEARLTTDPDNPVILPDPTHVLAHEAGPLGIEDWPAVYVLPLRLDSLTLVDVNVDGSEVYRATYALRFLAWVRADGYAETDALRKRYALAIREALLAAKVLDLTPPAVAGNPHADLTVDPTSIREDYSDVLLDETKRTIAGVDVTALVTVIELAEAPAPLGTVNTIDATSLPAHPALDG